MATPLEKVSPPSSDWIDSDALHYDHLTDGDLTAELVEEPHFRVVQDSKPLSEAYVDQSLNEDAYALLFGPLVWEEQNIEEPPIPEIDNDSAREVLSEVEKPLPTLDSEISFLENLEIEKTEGENPSEVFIESVDTPSEENSVSSESSISPIEEPLSKTPTQKFNIYGEPIPSNIEALDDQLEGSSISSHRKLKSLGIFTLIIVLGAAGFLTIDHLQGGTYFKKLQKIDFGKLFHDVTGSHLTN